MPDSRSTDDEARTSGRSLWFVVLFIVAVAGLLGIRSWIARGDERLAAPEAGPRPTPGGVYDPTEAGELLPPGYRELLGRDQIFPIYDPAFVASNEVDWATNTLVIGIAGDETAKAYPVTHLNRREMVIDSLEGIPILVSW
jgi:hypothetical protein